MGEDVLWLESLNQKGKSGDNNVGLVYNTMTTKWKGT